MKQTHYDVLRQHSDLYNRVYWATYGEEIMAEMTDTQCTECKKNLTNTSLTLSIRRHVHGSIERGYVCEKCHDDYCSKGE